MKIGKAIRTIRREQNLTQGELVKRTGHNVHTYISLVECGHVDPTLDKIAEIANALGMTASELVKRAEELS